MFAFSPKHPDISQNLLLIDHNLQLLTIEQKKAPVLTTKDIFTQVFHYKGSFQNTIDWV